MKNFRKKISAFLFAAVLAGASLSAAAEELPVEGISSEEASAVEELSQDGASAEAAAAAETQVTIYHTNDTHGYLEGDGESIIGLPLVAGLRNADPDSILVDAGDATQGLPIASLTKGNDVIRLMNLAGYDLMVPGNHEFDFGTDAFLTNAGLAEFPVISSNIYRGGSLLLSGIQEGNSGCHTIIERNGVKVGFFGLTTTETASATNPEGIQGLEFTDEIEAAKQEITHLEEAGADVIIAVGHLGDETAGAPCTSADLAEAMTGEFYGDLDVIIDGHSHTVENAEVNDVLIVQTGTGLNALGKLTVTVLADGEVEAEESLLSVADFADVTPDAATEELLAQISVSQDTMLGESIGQTATTLWAGWIGQAAPTRFVETNYGNLAADAFADAGRTMLAASGNADMPVVGIENGGGIRAAVYNGNITLGSLTTAFPFSNTLYMKVVTPALLYDVMEVSGSDLDGQDPETGMLLQTTISGGFLQISGFNVVFNPDAEAGNRVVSITLDGQDTPLDREDTETQIIVVGNNYIMSGGNDYTMLGSLPKYAEAGGELETIQSYITANVQDGVLAGYRGTEGRISYTGSVYRPKDYEASVLIKNEDGTPYANGEITYRVDGGEGMKGTTDADGILKVTVSDGGHGIRVSDSQSEVYVDNYTGIGIVVDAIRAMPELTVPEAGSEIPVTEEPDPEPAPAPDPDPEEKPGNNVTADPGGNDGDKASDTGKTKENGKAVQTGDEEIMMPAAVLLAAMAFSAGAAVAVYRKKRTKESICH